MKYIFYLFISLLIMSCSSDDLSFNEEYDSIWMNYVGQWQVETNRKAFIEDTLAFESNYTLDLVLHEDGTGTQESFVFIAPDSISWFVELYPERFTILRSIYPTDPTFSGPFFRYINLVHERTPDYMRMTSEALNVGLITRDSSFIVKESEFIRIE